MFHRIEHLLFPIAVVIFTSVSLIVYRGGIQLPLPFTLSALIPQQVGDRPAPVPKLEIRDISLSEVRLIQTPRIRQSMASSLGSKTVPPKYTLREYSLTWKMTVEDGSFAPVTAQVFVPRDTIQTDAQFPIIVYGAGSTGLADRCAPSKEDLSRGNMGDYRNYMIAQASQGYIVVMPNYEGFDNPDRNQHYFNKDSEARTLLSSAKALLESSQTTSLPIKKNALFFGGYSQGGHSAFSAADYASTYTPDMPIAGVYGHGPTTNVVDLLRSNPNLSAYFFASYSEFYPAIKPAEILKPEWVGYLERARRLCVNEGFSAGSTNTQTVFVDAFRKALLGNTLEQDFPAIHAVFSENTAGTSYTMTPTMIVQGTTDPIVTLKEQDAFVRQLCERSVPVNYKRYPGVHHFQTRSISFRDTNAWIDAVVSGRPVSNNCTEFQNQQ